jgi:hypothetical protein
MPTWDDEGVEVRNRIAVQDGDGRRIRGCGIGSWAANV